MAKTSRVCIAMLAGVLAAICASAGAAEQPASSRTISVDEISAGMQGYGFTVVRGGRPERFDVEVLGVIRKIAPGRDAIIIKASGAGLEHSGIFGGMSGSPVYFDDRLAGAVAFGWGWPKDAVAGVTPIADMEKGLEKSAPARAAGAAHLPFDIADLVEGVSLDRLPPAGAAASRSSRSRAASLFHSFWAFRSPRSRSRSLVGMR